MHCWSRRSSRPAARSKSRCRPARGTTSRAGSALAGRQVIRYRATLDKLPMFGREGYALPLGPVVQHTGEIDPAQPLAALYLFGKPTQALEGFAQAKIAWPKAP